MNLLIIISIIVIFIVLIFIFHKSNVNSPNKNIEDYTITYGMMGPQIRSYDRCVNDCFRDHSGDSGNEQLLWDCTRKCRDFANNRAKCKYPDLTPAQHQRHVSCFETSDPEVCYCLKDIETFCKERICWQSSDPDLCLQSCIAVKSVDCTSGLPGGWRP